MNAVKFLLIFAALVLVYGFAIYRTGDAGLIPYRARHSIASKEDVRLVGLVTMRVGLVLAGVLLVALLIVPME